MQPVITALADGATVVTANNRLARSIALAYNRAQRAAGRGAWASPDVLPWSAWLERLYDDAAIRAVPGCSQRRLLNDAQSRLVFQQMIERDRAETAWATAGAMADMAWRAWQLCRSWQVSIDSLIAAADSDDSALFAGWATEFVQHCRERDWSDSASMPELLVHDLRQDQGVAPSRLLFAGFDQPSPQQLHFIAALERLGAQATWLPIPRQPQCETQAQVRCTTASMELDCAARWARSLREQCAAATVAVVVPDLSARPAEVRRAFLDVLAPDWRMAGDEQQTLNLSLGAPLAQVPVIHVALLALRALTGDADYRDIGQLLRSPYLAGAAAETAGRAGLDLLLRERIGVTVELTSAVGAAQDLAPLLAAQLRAMLVRRQNWPARQGTADWADAFRLALGDVGWPGDRGLDAGEYQAVAAWQRLLEQFAHVEVVLGRLGLAKALGVLGSMARSQLFQPEGRPDAIQVMGAIEAVGQLFDGLWVCGMTSDAWPPAGRPSPLLPLALQRRLRMPNSSPSIIREHSERLLRHLIGSGRQVTLSWPETRDEEPLAPSGLLQSVPDRAVGELPRWAAESYRHRLAEARRLEALATDAAPPVAANRAMRGGARLLAQQARCPARAFAEMRLGAAELPVPAPGIGAALRGQIVHAVLERLFADLPDQAALRRLSDEDARDRLAHLAGVEMSRRLPVARPLIARMAQIEAGRVVALGQAFLATERDRPPFLVEASEAARAVSMAGLRLRLRPDRVDRLGGGERLVIDYKTGGGFRPAGWLGSRLRDPQLPLYAVMLDASAIAIIELRPEGLAWQGVGAAGLGLPNVKEPGAFSRGLYATWADMCGSWRTALETVAAEFMAGDFRVNVRDPELAAGRWAMLTRVHEQSLVATEEDE